MTLISPCRRRKPSIRFVGDDKQKETPVPIPNTAVKLLLPMILPCGKVGHRRLHDRGRANSSAAVVFEVDRRLNAATLVLVAARRFSPIPSTRVALCRFPRCPPKREQFRLTRSVWPIARHIRDRAHVGDRASVRRSRCGVIEMALVGQPGRIWVFKLMDSDQRPAIRNPSL